MRSDCFKQFFMVFDLVSFYGTSTIVDYSMPNSVYTHILSIYNL